MTEKAAWADIDEVARLYDEIHDYLGEGVNPPGWAKDIYPVRETAEQALKDGALFVLREGGEIAGTIILNHEPETGYENGSWAFDADYKDVIVIHTLGVSPRHLRKGIAKRLMDFAQEYARQEGMKAVRLDVFTRNAPAIALYEKCGYAYAGTVDLGYGQYGLDWFRLYEKVL